MCGIVGMLQFESEIDRSVRSKALRILFSEAMLKTEPRGDDATGLYQVQANSDWMLAKKGEKVTKWLLAESGGDDPGVYRDFAETWDQHPFEMTAMVGHCRKATVGSRGLDNDDNHPFAVQLDEKDAILGIHNGTLHNHEVIFKKLQELSESHLIRQGSVDSESIFHMMYHATEHGSKPVDSDVLQYMGKRIDGAYACIVVNSRFPKQVVTFRDGRPMEFAMIAPLNVVFIASEKKFIESALEKYEFIRQWTDTGAELPELQVEHRGLLEKDFRIFDLSKPFPKVPGWHSLDDVSEKGMMLKCVADIEEDWRAPTKTTTHTKPNIGPGYKPATSKANTRRGTGSGSSSSTEPSRVVGPTATKKGGDDDLVTVNAEVKKLEIGGEEEAKAGYEKAKLLGLCPSYDMIREVGAMIGLTDPEVQKLTILELANKVGQAHFNFGYAMGRVDSKQEVDDIRKKGRDQTKLLEKTAEKQRRAQSHIWELKQAILIYRALSDGRFPITFKNLGIVLNGYTKYNSVRKADIMNAIKAIFKDQGAEKQVVELVAEFERAQRQAKGKATKE